MKKVNLNVVQANLPKAKYFLELTNKSVNEYICYTDIFLCVPSKHATHKIHMKLHPGSEWCFCHILVSEDIDDLIPSLSWILA